MPKKVVNRKAHHRKGYIRKDGVRVRSTKVRATRYKTKTDTSLNILIAHDNRLGNQTTKAHKFAERLGKKKDFNPILDKDYWKLKETTSKTETDKRERDMVKKSDMVIRIVNPPSKTGERRHDGALSEVRKAIKAGKPVMEIYEGGAKESSTRPISERNYKNRIKINLKPGETLDKAFSDGLKQFKKKKII